MKARGPGLAGFAALLLFAALPPPESARASVLEHGDPPNAYYNAGVPDRMFGRDREFDLLHQAIDLRVDMKARTIEGRTILLFTPTRAADRIRVQAGEMTITACSRGVKRDLPLLGPDDPARSEAGAGVTSLHWTAEAETLTVLLGETIQPGDTVTVTLSYHAAPRKGLYFRDPVPGSPNRHASLFSQGETENNHYWFPCRDYPDDRASSEVRATVLEPFTAVSNGTLLDTRDNADGTRTFHWFEKVPHTTYLTSLAVAVYEETALPVDPASTSRAPLVAYGFPGDRERVVATLGKTGEIVAAFERLTGAPYPCERYAQVFVTRFLYSGMENIGATTLTEWTLHRTQDKPDFESEPLVAHEIAHQWFGDLITCRTWSHAWLNEGFATYFTLLYFEDAAGEDDFHRRTQETLDNYLNGSRRSRRSLVVHNYLPGEAPFDRVHAYNKGAMVLHLLRFVLGDDAFFSGVRAYVREHGGGVVETADLRRSMEVATGHDLGLFFRQWVEGPGHPELEISQRWDEEAGLTTIKVKQVQADDGEMPVFSFPLDVLVVPERSGSTVHRFEVSSRDEAFHIASPERPRMVVVDPEARVLGTIKLDVEAKHLRRIAREAPTVIARARAIRALARSSANPADIDTLAVTLHQDPSWWVRVEAAKALATLPGDRAGDALVGGLSDRDSRVRSAAATALVDHPDDDAARALLASARTDASESVRGEAAASLGAVVRAHSLALAGTAKPAVSPGNAEDALNDLLEVSSHRDVIRAGALRGLVALRSPQTVDTAVRSTGESRGDFERLAAVPAIGEAAGALDRDDSPELRDRAYGRLAHLLDDPFFRVRLAAIEALGTLGDARAAPLIERAAAREWEGNGAGAGREALGKLTARAGDDEIARLRESLRAVEKKQAELETRIDALGKRAPD